MTEAANGSRHPAGHHKIIRTIREQIATRIRHDVLTGRFAAGERLIETRLAAEFGVSRGPVRDALLQLTQEGVLLYRPNCGVEVAPAANDHMRGLFMKLRRTIEVDSLALVVPRVTDADLADWEEILAGLRAAGERQDLPAVTEHDMAFHRWIVEATGEPELLHHWLPITVRIRLVYSRHADLREVYPEHKAILDAVRHRDLKNATRALEANLV